MPATSCPHPLRNPRPHAKPMPGRSALLICFRPVHPRARRERRRVQSRARRRAQNHRYEQQRPHSNRILNAQAALEPWRHETCNDVHPASMWASTSQRGPGGASTSKLTTDRRCIGPIRGASDASSTASIMILSAIHPSHAFYRISPGQALSLLPRCPCWSWISRLRD